MSDQGKEAAMSLADQIEFVENNLAQHKAIVAELSSKVSGDWITKSKEAIDNYNAILATLKSLQATVSLPSEPSPFHYKSQNNSRSLVVFHIDYRELRLAAEQLAAQVESFRKDAERWKYIELLCGHGDVHIVCKDDGRFHLDTELAECKDVYSVGDTPNEAIDKALGEGK